MLAKAVSQIPDVGHVEPKWDGFRTIVFRDGDEVELGSRNERPMTRYFPEVVEAVTANLPKRCVLDGEIVIARGSRLDFQALQQRIHPATSRVTLLARETPASFVAFDMLALGDDSLMHTPFGERRRLLESALRDAGAPVFLTPATADVDLGRRWLDVFEGAGLDGVVAKPVGLPYTPDKRSMFKIKHERTADCVVAGFRWHKDGHGTRIGSLLLGLFDDAGTLHHVGVTSSFTMERRAELVAFLEPYRMTDLTGHPWAEWGEWAAAFEAAGQRVPGATSRWNRGKDLSWEALRPELVCEVAFDHLQGDRFRHGTTFLRFRTDREPASCRYDQLAETPAYELSRIFGA